MVTASPSSVGGSVRHLLGSPAQLVRIDRAVLSDGPAAGSPVLIVRNPQGISFEVLLDRAMDIGWADAAGMPLAWSAPRGRVASTRYEPQGTGWAHSFGGGLLTTCGLAATGMPSTVDGIAHPLHGRIGHTPAENVSWRISNDQDGAMIEITGEVVEAALSQPTLRLTRTIRARCDRPVITIEDAVTNDGFIDAGHMYRHHINLGYPLIDEGTVLLTDAEAFARRDGSAPVSLSELDLAVADGAVDESVTYARSGISERATVASPRRGVALTIDWSADTFPLLLAWRDASPGTNVLGLEPSTSRDGGRAEAASTAELITLAPTQSRSYRTTMSLARLTEEEEADDHHSDPTGAS